jgi:predicted phage terminase large subunit-like protein
MPGAFDWTFVTVDTSYKEKQENDFTAFSSWGVIREQLYLRDVFLRQMKAADIEGVLEPWVKRQMGYGYRGTWIEPKGHGIYLNQTLETRGLMIPGESQLKDFYSDRRHDKVERANNVVPQLAYRFVYINQLISIKEELVAQCLGFPKTKHDDFCDTLIDALKIVFHTKPSILDYC